MKAYRKISRGKQKDLFAANRKAEANELEKLIKAARRLQKSLKFR